MRCLAERVGGKLDDDTFVGGSKSLKSIRGGTSYLCHSARAPQRTKRRGSWSLGRGNVVNIVDRRKLICWVHKRHNGRVIEEGFWQEGIICYICNFGVGITIIENIRRDVVRVEGWQRMISIALMVVRK